jgi:hypothetical protein
MLDFEKIKSNSILCALCVNSLRPLRLRFIGFILFQFLLFSAFPHPTSPLLARATPAPEKKKEKQKQQKDESILQVNIPAEKTQEEIDEENTKLLNQKWEKYLGERIAEIQQLFDEISQLDSNTVTKEHLEEYHLAVNNLKEKFDFKLGNDPLWKENDALDEKRAQFSETHARTVKKLQYWDEFLVAPKKTNKLIIIGMALLAVMAIVPIFSQVKAALSVKNAKKEAQKMMQQQQKDAEKQRLLSDENNIITIK